MFVLARQNTRAIASTMAHSAGAFVTATEQPKYAAIAVVIATLVLNRRKDPGSIKGFKLRNISAVLVVASIANCSLKCKKIRDNTSKIKHFINRVNKMESTIVASMNVNSANESSDKEKSSSELLISPEKTTHQVDKKSSFKGIQTILSDLSKTLKEMEKLKAECDKKYTYNPNSKLLEGINHKCLEEELSILEQTVKGEEITEADRQSFHQLLTALRTSFKEG